MRRPGCATPRPPSASAVAIGSQLSRGTRDLFAAIVGHLVVPLVCVGAGISSEHILLVEMLMLGQIFLVAAPFISPRLLLNCLLPWAGAAAVAGGAPVLQTFTIISMLGVLVFALSWSYAPPARHIFSRVVASPSTRTRD